MKKQKQLRTEYVPAQMRVITETTKTRVLIPVKVRKHEGRYGRANFEVMTPWGVEFRTAAADDDVRDDLVGPDGMPFDGRALTEQINRLERARDQAEEKARHARRMGRR